MQKFFATCPKGLESLLFNELREIGAQSVKETVSGVSFSADMKMAMKTCLYSRFASRILLVLNTYSCEDDTDLYLGANGIAYEQYFASDKTIAVTFNGYNQSIRNTQYGALRVKDAICDRFVASGHERPNVDRHDPDVHIVATLKKGEATVSIDLSGSAQFFREYHRSTGAAPLKENLAAAMVVRSGFDGTTNFIDPMCGSATLLIEAASIATGRAPGLMRSNFGFMHLKDFNASEWSELKDKAQSDAEAGLAACLERGVHIYGFDADARVIEHAKQNIENAGFSSLITVSHSELEQLKNPCTNDLKCTVVTNPPYGERMGNFNELIMLYTTLGQKLKSEFSGGVVAVISTSQELLSCLRLSADKSYKLYNGALECQLRVFKLRNEFSEAEIKAQSARPLVAQDFANRLTKNLKNIEKWAKREDISAYRVYDADLPEYNAAIDCYNDFYVIQEYQAPDTIKAHVAKQRLLDLIAATVSVTEAKGSKVIVKSREKQKGDSQYIKREDATGNFMEVHEGDTVFKVNLQDYLDTGLFLDARPIRRLIASLSRGKSFLNLFAYTATASVMAAKGGATTTTSVDMSRTYLDWGMDNFKLNGLSTQNHNFVQADCLAYLSKEQGALYDLIYIDPPTFSNSKRMERSFDVQRDHVELLGNLTRHLVDGGKVIFMTNKRGFKLDEAVSEYGFSAENITDKSFDPDFKRDDKLHTCFMLTFDKSKMTKEPTALVTNTARPRWSQDLGKKNERFTFKGEAASRREGGFGEGRSHGPRRDFRDGDKPRRDFRDGDRARRDFREGDRPRRDFRDGDRPRRDFRDGPRPGGKGFARPERDGERGSFNRTPRDNRRDGARQAPPRAVRVWGPSGVKEL